MNSNQLERYSRHLLLKEVGEVGQEKLLSSRVLIIGAGGLGSPVILYLAAAGVGTIGIFDGDTVSLSNLQRQILHSEDSLGKNKSLSARERVKYLNAGVKINIYPEYLDTKKAFQIFPEYDIIVDATDNFETKFLINDAAVRVGTPFCHGGVLEFNGQIMMILPGDTACYRCVFGNPPACSEKYSKAGILGTTAGIVGTLQASEVIKFLIGTGTKLNNELLTVDTMNLEFRRVPVRKDSHCFCSS